MPPDKALATGISPESVRSRYAVTLSAQLFRMILALITAAIVPRALGPAVFGSYSFLLSTSSALRGFLDTGTQQAFFTFSSQERQSGALTKLYAAALGLQFALVLMVLAVSALTGRLGWLWHAQLLDQIILVTVLDWLLFLATVLQQLGDSKGMTAYLQLAGGVVAVLNLVGLVLLWLMHALNFYSFVLLNLAAAALSCTVLGYRLLVREKATFWTGVFTVRNYAMRWWRFTKPMIVLQYYFPLVAYLGVYLLQRWYASEEQGYYGLALQWCSFAMVFTNAGVWIFWREVAHGNASGGPAQTAATYQQFSRLFFFLAIVLSCWLSATSTTLVRVVAGDRYKSAEPVLAILAFYPVVQTLGQLTMVSLKATERTATYARWSAMLSVPDLALTYLMLAPSAALVPGLHLGAVGLAIKTSVYGLASVEVYSWLNCRFLGLSYLRTLWRRIAVTCVVGAAGISLLGVGGAWLQRAGFQGTVAVVLPTGAYGAVLAMILWLRPGMAGLNRAQLFRYARPIRGA